MPLSRFTARLPRRLLICAPLLLLLIVPSAASAQGVRPGTTVGDNCTKYRDIPADQEYISYYQCRDGSTVKFVSYVAGDGQIFTYTEFRNTYGILFASTFSRSPVNAPGAIPLADSDVP